MMHSSSSIMAAVTALAFVTWSTSARAEPASIGKDVVFRVKLTSALDSRANRKGDKIAALVLGPEQFKGTTLEGQVDEAKSSGKVNKKSTLKFSFNTLVLAGGDTVAVGSQVRSYKNSKGKEGVDEEGNIVESKNNAAKVAVATGIATAIGAMAGGGKGTAIGLGAGLVGALIVVSVGTKAPAIAFAPGSEIEMLVSDRRER